MCCWNCHNIGLYDINGRVDRAELFQQRLCGSQYIKYLCCSLKKMFVLAGLAQWIECWPANQKAAGSIAGQSTCKRQRIDVFLTHRYFSLFLPPFPSL